MAKRTEKVMTREQAGRIRTYALTMRRLANEILECLRVDAGFVPDAPEFWFDNETGSWVKTKKGDQ